MTTITSLYYEVFDSELNANLFDPSNYQSRFDTQEEAFEVAMTWKKSNPDHTISIQCIRTTKAEIISF